MAQYKNFIIHEFDELDSTNSYGFNLAKNNQAFDREVVVANTQHSGRGRMDRKWEGLAGNLFCSIIVRPHTIQIDAANAHKFSFLTIVALHKAIHHFDHRNKIEMKWPNDLLINQKKIAGILLESELQEAHLDFAVIGVGVNILDYPDQVLFKATSLKEENINVLKDDLLKVFLDEFDRLYRLVENFGMDRAFATIKKLWQQHAYKMNEEMTIDVGDEKVCGTFVGIDDDGCATLLINDHKQKISFGDVS
jgi:BirA family biotin operon repressor/biotin-[acetyl-CoA-carboxylase] ligase